MKVRKILLTSGMLLATTLSVSACNTGKTETNKINVTVLNKGYGREWIDEIVANWEAENPGYKVNLNATASAASFIDKNLSSRNNTDDVYICVGADWKKYATAGKLLALDDFIEEEVDGMKVKDKVNDEYQESIIYTNAKGEKHTYRLPWTAGIGGIYYNAKMFENNGWEVPTTYEELVTLCDTIKNAEIPVAGSRKEAVKPFVFTGQNTDYFDYAVFTWWSQLVGKQNISEFFKYESKDNFDTSKNTTYAALKEATSMWFNLFSDSSNYVEGSKSKDNHTAQQNFLNGYAAMMFCGEWIYNEILSYNAPRDDFEIKFLPTPAKENAQYKNSAYVVGEDQYIAIPASTTRPELAKSFVKAVISNKGCESFAKNAHGLLAYKWDINTYKAQTENTYVKSVLDFKSTLTYTFTNFSPSALYLNSIIDIWGTGALRPFEGCITASANINTRGDVEAQKTAIVDSQFEKIASQVSGQWSTWQAQIGA